MIAVVQRVDRSSVTVEGSEVASIGRGLNVLVGIEDGDAEEDARWIVRKVANLRIFPDEEGRMNHSLLDVAGDLLLVSQFTLLGDCRRGNRPSFTHAAAPEAADELFEWLVAHARELPIKVGTGVFQAMMMVEILNDGPVTLLLDSRTSRSGKSRR